MKIKVTVVVAVVALAVAATVAYVMTRPDPVHSAGVPADPMAEKLGISANPNSDDPEKAAEREMAMLQSGEASRRIDGEIAKAEALIKKYGSDTDEHQMLARRIAMLKQLREKFAEGTK